MLKIKGVSLSYGTNEVLKNINLEFKSRKLYGIIGPNGAGKSSLLNLISGELNMNGGEIFVKDRSFSDYKSKEFAKVLSYMRQNTIIKFPYTVRELVDMGRYPYEDVSKLENDRVVLNKIELTGLSEYMNREVTNLSGGEKQRAVFAKILAQESDIVLIDEGFSNADIYHKIEFFKTLKEEVKKDKLIIMVMHDLFLARKFCDELVLLDKNGVYSFGESHKVLNRKSLKEVFKINGDFVNDSLVIE